MKNDKLATTGFITRWTYPNGDVRFDVRYYFERGRVFSKGFLDLDSATTFINSKVIKSGIAEGISEAKGY